VAVLWPLITAVLTALRMLASLVVFPDAEAPRPLAPARRRGRRRGNGADGVSEPQQP
jgi:hypothetical protein